MPSAAKTKKKPSGAETFSYQKVITRPGTYQVPAKKTDPKAFQREDGRWVKEETFTIDRLKGIAAIAAEMAAEKIKIPAPFAHRDKDRNTIRPTKIGNDGATLDALTGKPFGWDASINGGHWRDLQVVDDVSTINPEFEKGPGLVGIVDTFGDPNDMNTPAGKVSRTVQETSICVIPSYKPPQSDKEYKDYIAHIAMPIHAIEPGQDNFAAAEQQAVAAMSEESDDDLFAVCMSDLVSTNAAPEPAEQDDAEMVEVLGFLQQLKIDLPPDTNRDNLVSILRLVLRQKIADQKEMTQQGNPLTQAPAGSVSKPAPIAMSQSNDKIANALLLRENRRKQDELRGRLNRIIKRGSHEMTPELIQELNNEINVVSMSADDINEEDGSFPVSTIEKTIAVLERTGRPMTGSLVDDESMFAMSAPEGSHVVDPPAEGEIDLPEDHVNSILSRLK